MTNWRSKLWLRFNLPNSTAGLLPSCYMMVTHHTGLSELRKNCRDYVLVSQATSRYMALSSHIQATEPSNRYIYLSWECTLQNSHIKFPAVVVRKYSYNVISQLFAIMYVWYGKWKCLNNITTQRKRALSSVGKWARIELNSSMLPFEPIELKLTGVP